MYQRIQPPEKMFFDGCNYTFSTVAEGKKWYAEDDAYHDAHPLNPQPVSALECAVCAGGVTYVSSSSTFGDAWKKNSLVAPFALNIISFALVCFIYWDACKQQSCAASLLKFGAYVRFEDGRKKLLYALFGMVCLLFVALAWQQAQLVNVSMDLDKMVLGDFKTERGCIGGAYKGKCLTSIFLPDNPSVSFAPLRSDSGYVEWGKVLFSIVAPFVPVVVAVWKSLSAPYRSIGLDNSEESCAVAEVIGRNLKYCVTLGSFRHAYSQLTDAQLAELVGSGESVPYLWASRFEDDRIAQAVIVQMQKDGHLQSYGSGRRDLNK